MRNMINSEFAYFHFIKTLLKMIEINEIPIYEVQLVKSIGKN